MTDMSFRQVGHCGLTVSVIGLGTNNLGLKLDEAQSREVVYAALDAGITFFDTAQSYGASEERLGELLSGRRSDVVLATKFGTRRPGSDGTDWGPRGSRRYIRHAVERSLRNLRTDWIDLYQMHWPDPATPVDETLSALTDLVHEGKVRYIGHSNFRGWQVAEADWVARTRGHEHFVSGQNRYSLLDRGCEADLVPALRHYGLGLIPHSPLASGILTGKYRRGEPAPVGSRLQAWGREAQLTDRAFDVVEKLRAFAAERGASLLDIAIGGLAAQPAVASVIAGATTREQVAANVRAAAWQPSEAERAAIDAITVS